MIIVTHYTSPPLDADHHKPVVVVAGKVELLQAAIDIGVLGIQLPTTLPPDLTRVLARRQPLEATMTYMDAYTLLVRIVK